MYFNISRRVADTVFDHKLQWIVNKTHVSYNCKGYFYIVISDCGGLKSGVVCSRMSGVSYCFRWSSAVQYICLAMCNNHLMSL